MPCHSDSLSGTSLPVALRLAMPEETILRFILVCLVSLASTLSVIYYLGLDLKERSLIIMLVNKKILKRNGLNKDKGALLPS